MSASWADPSAQEAGGTGLLSSWPLPQLHGRGRRLPGGSQDRKLRQVGELAAGERAVGGVGGEGGGRGGGGGGVGGGGGEGAGLDEHGKQPPPPPPPPRGDPRSSFRRPRSWALK